MFKPENTDAYIASFAPDVQSKLQSLRTTIMATAPGAVEVISYGLPAFKLHGAMLVWFAAHTKHVGLYPRASGVAAFAERLKGYKFAKGSIQFPFDEPLPLELITDIVKFRVGEILAKGKKK